MTHLRIARLQKTCFVFFLALLLSTGLLSAQQLKLQVLGTTDLHGHVLPQDTYSMQPVNKGWAKLATLIRQAKAENPNTLLIDSGDTIEGEPINYVRTRLRPDLAEPSIAVMNELGYSAMAIGNHDFNWGLDVLRSVEKQAKFPFLSANTVTVKGGKAAFTPWTKVNIGGATVIIVGFTTPGIPRWEEPENYAGLAFQDIVETAKVLIPRLREKEKADVIIVTMHSGLGTLPGQMGDENCAMRLVDQVPGIDLILSGHTHLPISSQYKGIPILQGAAHGRALAVADLTLQKTQGRWRVMASQGRLVQPTADTPQDAQVLELTASLRIGHGYLLEYRSHESAHGSGWPMVPPGRHALGATPSCGPAPSHGSPIIGSQLDERPYIHSGRANLHSAVLHPAALRKPGGTHPHHRKAASLLSRIRGKSLQLQS